MDIQKTYKFRLYPTKKQEQKLLWTLDKCRFVHNKLLEGLNKQEKINRSELQHSIVGLKKEHPDLRYVYSKVLQYENYRLFSNLKALSQLKKKGKKVGRLRFKGKCWFKTFTYNQSGFKIIQVETTYDKLQMSKIGDIPFLMHRKIEGKIKQLIIKHMPSGRWFVSVTTETKEKIKKTANYKKVGIDLGLDKFIYDSDDNKTNHPRYLNKSLEKMKKEQRKLSRKKKRSNNRIKQKVKVARIHEKIVNQRDDFLHKLSRLYVDNYGFIACENLNIKGMVRNHCLAKSIMDASWSRFIQMLEYKAERAGIRVVKVEPRGTTQTCSHCRRIVDKELWNRIHKCECGLTIDRDYNSAINILKRALGQELSEFTPVETKPLPVRASLIGEAGSHFLNQ